MHKRTGAIVGCVTAGLVALAAPGPLAARPKPPPLVGTLAPGESTIWLGPEKKGVHRFRLELDGSGARLRVFGQTREPFGFLDGMVEAPDGRKYPFDSNSEAFVADPQPGTWTVVVERRFFDDPYRVRAKLETPQDVRGPDEPRWLKPNLRSMPPFQFTFRNPTVFGAGIPLSCGPDEVAEEGGRKCLRFSVGPENTGAGAFELYLTPLVDATVGEATVYQHVQHSSGRRLKILDAGTYEYHKTHGHYHYAGFASLELLRVGRDGRLEPAGTGKKIGFCTVDVVVAQFERFAQDPQGSARNDCNRADGAWIGLSRGWTDIYDWSTSGNYVEFGANEDGRYVVRSGFDTEDLVDETNERDNYAYALIEVSGTRVKILERGYGKDPWDPRKEVVRPWWR